MTGAPEMERTIANLEGATQVLNNFASSRELTTETADGLHWLAMEIDSLMVELRNGWDALDTEKPPLQAVKE